METCDRQADRQETFRNARRRLVQGGRFLSCHFAADSPRAQCNRLNNRDKRWLLL